MHQPAHQWRGMLHRLEPCKDGGAVGCLAFVPCCLQPTNFGTFERQHCHVSGLKLASWGTDFEPTSQELGGDELLE